MSYKDVRKNKNFNIGSYQYSVHDFIDAEDHISYFIDKGELDSEYINCFYTDPADPRSLQRHGESAQDIINARKRFVDEQLKLAREQIKRGDAYVPASFFQSTNNDEKLARVKEKLERINKNGADASLAEKERLEKIIVYYESLKKTVPKEIAAEYFQEMYRIYDSLRTNSDKSDILAHVRQKLQQIPFLFYTQQLDINRITHKQLLDIANDISQTMSEYQAEAATAPHLSKMQVKALQDIARFQTLQKSLNRRELCSPSAPAYYMEQIATRLATVKLSQDGIYPFDNPLASQTTVEEETALIVKGADGSKTAEKKSINQLTTIKNNHSDFSLLAAHLSAGDAFKLLRAKDDAEFVKQYRQHCGNIRNSLLEKGGQKTSGTADRRNELSNDTFRLTADCLQELARLNERMARNPRGSQAIKDLCHALDQLKRVDPQTMTADDLRNQLSDAMKYADQYLNDKKALHSFSSTQLERLKCINQLKTMERMLHDTPPTDPLQPDGQAKMLATKLACAAVIGERPSSLTHAERIEEASQAIEEDDVFKSFVKEKGNEISATLKSKGMQALKAYGNYKKNTPFILNDNDKFKVNDPFAKEARTKTEKKVFTDAEVQAFIDALSDLKQVLPNDKSMRGLSDRLSILTKADNRSRIGNTVEQWQDYFFALSSAINKFVNDVIEAKSLKKNARALDCMIQLQTLESFLHEDTPTVPNTDNAKAYLLNARLLAHDLIEKGDSKALFSPDDIRQRLCDIQDGYARIDAKGADDAQKAQITSDQFIKAFSENMKLSSKNITVGKRPIDICLTMPIEDLSKAYSKFKVQKSVDLNETNSRQKAPEHVQ